MTTTSISEENKEPREVRRLRQQLAVSRQIHGLTSDPMMAAVRIDRLRRSVTGFLWFFLACGLGFTTTGVQDFLAGHLSPADPVWWGSWAVEPALAGILIQVLRWEAEMIARRIAIDSGWVTGLKWVLLGSTLVMNLVPVIWPRSGGVSAGMVFAHAAVPVLVFFLAEVMPIVQSRCAQARDKALATLDRTSNRPAEEKAGGAVVPDTGPVARSAVSGPSTPEPPAPVVGELEAAPVVQPDPAVKEAAVPSAPVPAVPPLALDDLGIPPAMQGSIRELVRNLALDGRRATAEDVTRATRLPASIAARVVDRIPAVVNGHTH